MKRINLLGESLFLHGQKAVWWPKEKTLLVADTHFSKDSVFRQHGIALPRGNNKRDLERLTEIIEQTKAERLIVLGDFVHGSMPPNDPFFEELTTWKHKHLSLTLEVVAGNHDRHIDKSRLDNIVWYEALHMPPFTLQHEPAEEKGKYILAGHIHPVVYLSIDRSDKLRLPAMVCTQYCALLPSFGSMTGGFKIDMKNADTLYAFAHGDVMQIK